MKSVSDARSAEIPHSSLWSPSFWRAEKLKSRELESLSTPAQFQQDLDRERIRCTRRSFPFCLLEIQLASGRLGRKRQWARRQQIAEILHRYTRLTDYKSELSVGRFAVLMTDTPEMGGRSATDRLAGLLVQLGVGVTTHLNVHDPDGFDDPLLDDQRAGAHHGKDSLRGASIQIGVHGEEFVCDGLYQSAAINLLARCVQDPSPGLESRGDLNHRRWQSIQHGVAWGTDAWVKQHAPMASLTMASFIKRTVDVVGACVGLILASPVIAGAMLLIRMGDGGSAIFKQTREGQFGRPFTIFKLRTMQVGAEQSQAELRSQSHRDGPAFKISHDPRVTRLGQFLRKTCLDELPQLFNVLRGDMSLVGPRPLPWDESRACSVWHRRRLEVRPGMTCYWQINKSAAPTFDDWMRLDLQYLKQCSFVEDLRLIARTVTVPMTGRGSE